MQPSRPTRHAPPSPRQDSAVGDVGWFVSALVVLALVAVFVPPMAYFMAQAGLLEKTIAISTLVAVLATHVVKTIGR